MLNKFVFFKNCFLLKIQKRTERVGHSLKSPSIKLISLMLVLTLVVKIPDADVLHQM